MLHRNLNTAWCIFLHLGISFSRQDRLPDKSARGSIEQLTHPAGSPVWALLNINNFTTWVRRDAPGTLSPHGNNQAVFPRGTAGVVYTDGIYFGAKAYNDARLTIPAPRQLVRVGGKGYGYGLQAGWVDGFGSAATALPSTDPLSRIYRIRRDYASMSEEELRRDAADVNEIPLESVTQSQIEALRTQYALDWAEWPVSLGAPYIERNGTAGYQAPTPFGSVFTVDSLTSKNLDEPGIAGADPNAPADQVIWTVANDLNVSTSLGFAGSEPLGLELQFTIWGYKSYDILGQMFFKRIKIINKGGVDTSHTVSPVKGSFWLDSVFVGIWCDGDLGAFSDDLAGCDTVLQLGFFYNANALDDGFKHFGFPPPSIGYAYLQGPTLSNSSDTAVVNFTRIQGKKNLGLSSFWHHGSGLGNSEPCNTTGLDVYNCNTCGWWKLLRGFWARGSCSSDDIPLPHGPFAVTKFPYSGDPVTGSGFLDGLGNIYSPPPGDRRFMLNTGPFSMAPGDTQEILVAVVGGMGADRLSSVSVMKHNTRFARRLQRGLFAAARPVAAPRVTAIELDREIILEWGSDLNRVKQTEEPIVGGEYFFEGYTVHQLPTAGSRLSDGVRIATYDRINNITKVIEDRLDPRSGLLVPTVIQDGNDVGVKRFISIKKDYTIGASGSVPLNNGQEYYFAVTAYNYSTLPDAIPRSFESTPEIIRAKTRIPFGVSAPNAFGDTLSAVHLAGKSDGNVVPIVVNPLAGTGDTYEVRFDTTGGITTWFLANMTKSKVILASQINQSGDEKYHLVEGGILLRVIGPKPGMKEWQIPSGTRRFSSIGGELFFGGYSPDGFSYAIGWDDPAHYFGSTSNRAVPADRLRTVLLSLAVAGSKTTGTTGNGSNPYGGWDETTTTDPNMSYAYRYLGNAAFPAARLEFSPYIVNTSASYSYQDYKKGVPLSAWDMETNPPTRLAVGFLENNTSNGLVDGKWWPPQSSTSSNTDSFSPREWLFIFDRPYSGAIPDSSLQQNLTTTSLPVMWWLAVTRRSGNDFNPSSPTGTDQFLIVANHVNFVNDIFTYTSPSPETGPEIVKESAKRVGLFPNPYVGGRDQETTAWRRFVTFNNLPPRVKIYIFNLAGHMIRMLEKNDPSQFLEWDLTNNDNWQVASGIYICYVEMPDIGETKILKLAVIQSELPAR